MNKSHRLDNNAEDFVGEDDRTFPTGINHVVNHRVPPSEVVVKNVPGPFVPYAGQVFHGVMPGEGSYANDPYEQATYQATMEHEYADLPPQLQPVPVIIVPPESGPEGINSWRAVNLVVNPGKEQPLMPKDTRRSRMRIRNEATLTTDGIRICAERGECDSGSGYLIPGGSAEELFGQTEVYVIATANTVKVSVFAEYVVNG